MATPCLSPKTPLGPIFKTTSVPSGFMKVSPSMAIGLLGSSYLKTIGSLVPGVDGCSFSKSISILKLGSMILDITAALSALVNTPLGLKVLSGYPARIPIP